MRVAVYGLCHLSSTAVCLAEAGCAFGARLAGSDVYKLRRAVPGGSAEGHNRDDTQADEGAHRYQEWARPAAAAGALLENRRVERARVRSLRHLHRRG